MLVFMIFTLISLSLVSHKEQRFMSSILPIFAVTVGNGFLHMSNQGNKYFRYYFIRCISIIYIIKEQLCFIPQSTSDKLLYTIFHDRSTLALDLSEYKGDYEFEKFQRVESVYVINKFGAPISTWAHSHSSEDQITVLTPTCQDPEFFFVKYMMPFR
jgi:hypothetical protein